jgi:hypothetical protein
MNATVNVGWGPVSLSVMADFFFLLQTLPTILQPLEINRRDKKIYID